MIFKPSFCYANQVHFDFTSVMERNRDITFDKYSEGTNADGEPFLFAVDSTLIFIQLSKSQVRFLLCRVTFWSNARR